MKGFIKVNINDEECEMLVEYTALKMTNKYIEFFGAKFENVIGSRFGCVFNERHAFSLENIIEIESIE